jgi:hypothetical protein
MIIRTTIKTKAIPTYNQLPEIGSNTVAMRVASKNFDQAANKEYELLVAG